MLRTGFGMSVARDTEAHHSAEGQRGRHIDFAAALTRKGERLLIPVVAWFEVHLSRNDSW